MTSHERRVVSNHRSFDCLFYSLCGPTSKRHQNLRYWPFVRGIHRWPVNSPHKDPVTRKKLPFDDVIMIDTNIFHDIDKKCDLWSVTNHDGSAVGRVVACSHRMWWFAIWGITWLVNYAYFINVILQNHSNTFVLIAKILNIKKLKNTKILNTWTPIQYKDDVLPTQEIELVKMIRSYDRLFSAMAQLTDVTFLCLSHERYPIARPQGRGMGCRPWVQIWPKFYYCAVHTIVSYITAICRESIVSVSVLVTLSQGTDILSTSAHSHPISSVITYDTRTKGHFINSLWAYNRNLVIFFPLCLMIQ